MPQQHLQVTNRERAGKGAARATRRDGKIPAVIYGGKSEPRLIALDPVALKKGLDNGGFFSCTHKITTDDGNEENVICRDIQLHPVSDAPQHVDFLRVDDDTRITVMIPIELQNRHICQAIKIGGILNIVRHNVEISCLAKNLPEKLYGDLQDVKLGQSMKISHIQLPESAYPTIRDRDFVICNINPPKGMKADAIDANDDGEEEKAS